MSWGSRLPTEQLDDTPRYQMSTRNQYGGVLEYYPNRGNTDYDRQRSRIEWEIMAPMAPQSRLESSGANGATKYI